MVFPKEFFEIVYFEKKLADDKLPSIQRVKKLSHRDVSLNSYFGNL